MSDDAMAKQAVGLKDFSSDHLENASTEPFISPEEEKRLLRKMDIRIMPILVALYVMSFLDRVNIGTMMLSNTIPYRVNYKLIYAL
jgi:hypothetical protein